MKVLFVEPPKDYWFVMGEYLPPPLGILNLAAYLEAKDEDVEIDVIDCQAESIDWRGLEKHVASFSPDIVAPSALSTCNTYSVIRTLETAKKVNPNTVTVVGGQHFTALADESLRAYPEIDYVVRGEGEQTMTELVRALKGKMILSDVAGISFRNEGTIIHGPDRRLMDNLDDLPLPGYHFVEQHMKKYHFRMMSGEKSGYALVEASRGCTHHCSFCSQWRFWKGSCRTKSPKRIVDEMEHYHREYGISFFWLTDDNFGLGNKTNELCDELIRRRLSDDVSWFMQARCDDVAENEDILPKMRRAGNAWMLLGLESPSKETLDTYRKGIDPSQARKAVELLKKNDIFCQATFIVGERRDSHESIQNLRETANELDPDIAIFMALTPFPGTDLYETARQNGWIEDDNWANYDMIHAIMPTENLTRKEVQEELYACYRGFYGSMNRRLKSIFSSNTIKRRTYQYMAGQDILRSLEALL